MRAHWFLPYFMTATLRISSSVFRQVPLLIVTRPIFDDDGALQEERQPQVQDAPYAHTRWWCCFTRTAL